ncbi:MAG: hypothetical protein GYA02_01660 [Clostridiaceae bacterium]|nr:hypothetical protein [Clostridiaceae bacterium]
MAYNTKKIALIGILGALTIISLLLAVVLPTTKLSFYCLSSFFISVIIIEYKVSAGWMFFVTTNLLAYLVIPDKLAVIPYTAFFSIYGIVKYYSEKAKSILLEFIIKYAFFNICLTLGILLAREFLQGIVDIKYSLWLVVIMLQIVFFIYDYAYTMVIRYYKNRLRKFIL